MEPIEDDMPITRPFYYVLITWSFITSQFVMDCHVADPFFFFGLNIDICFSYFVVLGVTIFLLDLFIPA